MRTLALVLLLSLPLASRAADAPLLLYGGEGFNTLLGCLNCPVTHPLSVWNPDVAYGRRHPAHSIWNRRGRFGDPASPWSPWHPESTTGPILLAPDGRYFGRFTANVHDKEQTYLRWAVWLAENGMTVRGDLPRWRQVYGGDGSPAGRDGVGPAP